MSITEPESLYSEGYFLPPEPEPLPAFAQDTGDTEGPRLGHVTQILTETLCEVRFSEPGVDALEICSNDVFPRLEIGYPVLGYRRIDGGWQLHDPAWELTLPDRRWDLPELVAALNLPRSSRPSVQQELQETLAQLFPAREEEGENAPTAEEWRSILGQTLPRLDEKVKTLFRPWLTFATCLDRVPFRIENADALQVYGNVLGIRALADRSLLPHPFNLPVVPIARLAETNLDWRLTDPSQRPLRLVRIWTGKKQLRIVGKNKKYHKNPGLFLLALGALANAVPRNVLPVVELSDQPRPGSQPGIIQIDLYGIRQEIYPEYTSWSASSKKQKRRDPKEPLPEVSVFVNPTSLKTELYCLPLDGPEWNAITKTYRPGTELPPGKWRAASGTKSRDGYKVTPLLLEGIRVNGLVPYSRVSCADQIAAVLNPELPSRATLVVEEIQERQRQILFRANVDLPTQPISAPAVVPVKVLCALDDSTWIQWGNQQLQEIPLGGLKDGEMVWLRLHGVDQGRWAVEVAPNPENFAVTRIDGEGRFRAVSELGNEIRFLAGLGYEDLQVGQTVTPRICHIENRPDAVVVFVIPLDLASDEEDPHSEPAFTEEMSPEEEHEEAVEAEGENLETAEGGPLSKSSAAWDYFLRHCSVGTVLNGYALHKIKGGFQVTIGLSVFLPDSQVADRRPQDLSVFVGKPIRCQVIKIDEERRNIIVSRRKLMELQRAEQKKHLLEEIEVGQVRKGIVKNIAEFGAFVDLGGLDGLLHITDMSWENVKDPRQVVSIDQEIEVYVLNVDREKEKIALSLKHLTPNPWIGIEKRYPVGSRHRGAVVNVMSYGAFVKLEPGIEGLVHISEMSWTKRINHPSELVSIGDTIEVQVLNINKEKQEISLGIKQTQENPWDKVAERYPHGRIVSGTVRNLTNYGAFIEIEEGIDGLLHISDMSWVRKVAHPSEVVQKGDKITCIVLNVDQERKRIALGLKQMLSDPWGGDIPARYLPGQKYPGKVTKLTNFGVFVELEPGLEGLLHISELADRPLESPDEVVKVGDEVQVKVLRVDVAERKIGLTLKAVDDPTVPPPEPVRVTPEPVAIAESSLLDGGPVERIVATESPPEPLSVPAVGAPAVEDAVPERGEDQAPLPVQAEPEVLPQPEPPPPDPFAEDLQAWFANVRQTEPLAGRLEAAGLRTLAALIRFTAGEPVGPAPRAEWPAWQVLGRIAELGKSPPLPLEPQPFIVPKTVRADRLNTLLNLVLSDPAEPLVYEELAAGLPASFLVQHHREFSNWLLHCDIQPDASSLGTRLLSALGCLEQGEVYRAFEILNDLHGDYPDDWLVWYLKQLPDAFCKFLRARKVFTVEGMSYCFNDRSRWTEGSLSYVLRVLDPEGRPCALKHFKLQDCTHGEMEHYQELFFREADFLRKIQHPNVVRLIASARGILILEWIEGKILKDEMDPPEGDGSDSFWNPQKAIDLAYRVALGMEAAWQVHGAECAHGDLHSGNIMVQRTAYPNPDWVKIIDFGLAHHGDRSESTKIADMVNYKREGGYRAPELASGELTAVADIYSLGGILFHLLFGPERTIDPADPVLHSPHPADPLGRPIPSEVYELLPRLLARNPWERPQRWAEILPILERGSQPLA